jgi:hypothetical protein
MRCKQELFREVDVNSAGEIEWEEFTEFVVEKASFLRTQCIVNDISQVSALSELCG